MHLGAALLYTFMLCDLVWRRVPNVLIGTAALLVIVFGGSLSGMALSGALTLFVMVLAGFPGGDVKAMTVASAALGFPDGILVTCCSLLLTRVLWWRHIITFPWMVVPCVSLVGYLTFLVLFQLVP